MLFYFTSFACYLNSWLNITSWKYSRLAKLKKVTSSQNKISQIRAERNILGLALLSIEHDVELELTSFLLGSLPLSLATTDVMPTKNQYVQTSPLFTIWHLVNIRLATLYTSCHKWKCHPTKLNGDSRYFCGIEPKQLPKAKRVDFITDTCQQVSIKFMSSHEGERYQPFCFLQRLGFHMTRRIWCAMAKKLDSTLKHCWSVANRQVGC